MDLVIIGAGGHGRVVLDIIREQGQRNPIGFVDANASLAGSTISGIPVIGPPNQLPKLRQRKVVNAIIAIGDNRTRMRYLQMLDDYMFELVNAIHPSATVSDTAKLGRNVVIAAGAVVSTDATIGDCAIVNTSAAVDHECVVEAGTHICPGALLAGRVKVGAGAFVGLGAKIIQCLSIGEHSVVGAGAVVLRDVPANCTAVGNPARVIKMGAMQAA
jgi:UDP-perosamine 4-acetyltransferase